MSFSFHMYKDYEFRFYDGKVQNALIQVRKKALSKDDINTVIAN